MCNLYSMTRSQDAVRQLIRVSRDRTGNMPPLSGIFPDTMAPVVYTAPDGERELTMMRWGFPPPPKGNRPVTNIRNLASPYWRSWLKPEFRCLVPATSFCEWTDSRPKITHWFALEDDRPLFAFAGLWRAPGQGSARASTASIGLFAFLTTESNALVRPIHAKAMPVILTSDDSETWLTAPVDEALSLQRPFPDDGLKIVATGRKEDFPAAVS